MNKLGLYLHVPFCRRKCAYCDFYSLPDSSGIHSYVQALCRSFSAFSDSASRSVDTVYFGGGTPSLLSPEEIQRIFTALRAAFSIEEGAEITMEMNPESAADPVLATARKEGVNRVSFGMQSACEAELAAIGRLHRFSDVRAAVRRARERGFSSISLDLMYGLPGQDLASFQYSLGEALALSPEHVSFYALTLSPEVPLYRRRALLPGEEEVREMYLFACDFLQKNGYDPYEISNAARPGHACRHNLRYWHGEEYLGFGPGAHSFWEGKRFAFPCDLAAFISAENHRALVEVLETLTPSSRLEEYVMLSLRLAEGIDLARLEQLGGKAVREEAEKKLARFRSLGLAKKTARGYRLTPEGFFVSNTILSELI